MRWTGIFYFYHHLEGFLFPAVHVEVFCPTHNAQSQVRSWPDVQYKSLLCEIILGSGLTSQYSSPWIVIVGGVLAYAANKRVWMWKLVLVLKTMRMHLNSTVGDPSAQLGSPSHCSLSCCLRAAHTCFIAFS